MNRHTPADECPPLHRTTCASCGCIFKGGSDRDDDDDDDDADDENASENEACEESALEMFEQNTTHKGD